MKKCTAKRVRDVRRTVYIEELNNIWNTPYLFNAMVFCEMTCVTSVRGTQFRG
ncbi:hypothetical protein [Bacteroides cellulosilyticus]|uniref:hypothetical protein n=1 Tax=Bacteroides cellulosilyticus TaxID=246787 RepID=UPI0032EEE374